MSAITSHVLDTARGRPAEGVAVLLERQSPEQGWHTVGKGFTDANGRLHDLLPQGATPDKGTYRLTFDTAAYYAAQNTRGFYPHISVVFVVHDPAEHYHIPLLLSRYGYTTYRGS